jgi:hypothetical protein
MKKTLEFAVAIITMFLIVVAVLFVVIGGPIIACAGVWWVICALSHGAFSWEIPIFIGLFVAMAAMLSAN